MYQPQPEALESLKTLLMQETETYRQLAGVLRDKREQLVNGRYHDIPQSDRRLASLGQEGIRLEAARMALMDSIGHRDVTLGQFAGLMEPEAARPLFDARKKLLAVVEEVTELNAHNRRLIDLSIRWVQDTVNVIAKAVVPETSSYNAKGRAPRADMPASTLQSTVVRQA